MSVFGSNLGSNFDPLGLHQTHEQIIPDFDGRRLAWILAFCGYTLDDLEDDVIARHRVAFYVHLDHEMTRRQDVIDLEKQWNPLGRST